MEVEVIDVGVYVGFVAGVLITLMVMGAINNHKRNN